MKIAIVVAVLVLAALVVACTNSAQVQSDGTENVAGDAGASLDSEFDTFDESTSSMADEFSDQDLAMASS
jgi:hypothetical protein